MELLNYIVEQTDADLECINNDWDTPLLMAVKSNDCNMAHTLIKRGADINAVDNDGRSPLYLTVEYANFEMLAMLLYYGADVDIIGGIGVTPFHYAIINRNYDAQELLIEYESDINCESDLIGDTLYAAITYRSPLILEIVKRGAVVGHYEITEAHCLHLDEEVLKILWQKYISYIQDDGADDSYKLLASICYRTPPVRCNRIYLLEYFSVIFYSPNVVKIIQDFEEHIGLYELLSYLIVASNAAGLSETELYPFICVCLSWGANVCFHTVKELHKYYGYNETLKLFLHIGVDMYSNNSYLPASTILRLICDINKDSNDIFSLYQVMDEDFEIKNYYNILQFFASPWRYIETINDNSDQLFSDEHVEIGRRRLLNTYNVPSLRELSREMSRKAVRTQFRASNTLQFYSVLHHLPIPDIMKKIIAYEMPLYEKIEPSNEEKKIMK